MMMTPAKEKKWLPPFQPPVVRCPWSSMKIRVTTFLLIRSSKIFLAPVPWWRSARGFTGAGGIHRIPPSMVIVISLTGIFFPARSSAVSTTYRTPLQHGTSMCATVIDRIA